jgi:hypothetical protein
MAKDVSSTEAEIMAIVQKPISTSILAEKSGPPAWNNFQRGIKYLRMTA